MRRDVALALSVTSMGLGAGLVACFDLFHPTDDILTACQLDKTACNEAGAEAGSDAETSFCTWDETAANETAEHACAWLGACEGPFGQNALGPCMFEALLAYDCKANPAHPFSGERRDRWDCLASATSCVAVDACIFPGSSVNCSGIGTACGNDGGNENVRVNCPDGGRGYGENCALWGQTCASVAGSAAFCAGNNGQAGLSCSAADSCEPKNGRVHSCDGGDVGIDCATNGAGRCSGFPAADAPSWVACMPVLDAGAACTPSMSVTCQNGVAYSCPAGVAETLDCAALLGDSLGCTPGQLHPAWDWTSPCVVSRAPTDAATDARAGATPDAGADAAACVESCTSGTITGCTRGAAYSVACTRVGLGPCQMVTSDPGQPPHAACTP
jgi:hypothetical protein